MECVTENRGEKNLKLEKSTVYIFEISLLTPELSEYVHIFSLDHNH